MPCSSTSARTSSALPALTTSGKGCLARDPEADEAQSNSSRDIVRLAPTLLWVRAPVRLHGRRRDDQAARPRGSDTARRGGHLDVPPGGVEGAGGNLDAVPRAGL